MVVAADGCQGAFPVELRLGAQFAEQGETERGGTGVIGASLDGWVDLRSGLPVVGGVVADFAQGGGPDGARAGAAVEAIENALARAVTG